MRGSEDEDGESRIENGAVAIRGTATRRTAIFHPRSFILAFHLCPSVPHLWPTLLLFIAANRWHAFSSIRGSRTAVARAPYAAEVRMKPMLLGRTTTKFVPLPVERGQRSAEFRFDPKRPIREVPYVPTPD